MEEALASNQVRMALVQFHGPLSAAMVCSSGWKSVYEDDTCSDLCSFVKLVHIARFLMKPGVINDGRLSLDTDRRD